MGFFRKKEKKDLEIHEMRLSERESTILAMEKEREEVVSDIELVMRAISKETRQRRLRAKKRR